MTTRQLERRFRVPLYSLADAARHIAVPRTTFDTCVRGYERQRDSGPTTLGEPIVTAVEALERELGIEHALASEQLYTDGAEVLYNFSSTHDDRPEGRAVMDLVAPRSGQRVFVPVVERYLKRIKFDTGYAGVLALPQYRRAEVIVDPRRSFGLPIFASGAARVEVVLGRFKAGESVEELSEEFGVPVDDLVDVIRVHTDAAA